MKAYTFSIICLSIAFLTWILIEDFESADKKKKSIFYIGLSVIKCPRKNN